MAVSSLPLPSTTPDAVLTTATGALDALASQTNQRVEAIQAESKLLHQHREQAAAIQAEKEAFRDRKRHRQEAEIKVLNEEIESIFHQLNSQLSDQQKQLDQALQAIPAQVNEQLMSDDRTLATLDADGRSNLEEQIQLPDLEEIQDLSNLLTTLTVEELQNRLDLTYLTHLNDSELRPAIDSTDDDGESETLKTLQADISSLYSDIHDVASMSLAQEYTNPYTQIKQQMQHIKTTAQEDRLTFTLKHLDYMTDSLTTLTDRIQTLHSHRALTDYLQATLRGLESEYSTLSRWTTPQQKKQPDRNPKNQTSPTQDSTQYPPTNQTSPTKDSAQYPPKNQTSSKKDSAQQYPPTTQPTLTIDLPQSPPRTQCSPNIQLTQYQPTTQPTPTIDLTQSSPAIDPNPYPATHTLLTHLGIPHSATLELEPETETEVSLASKISERTAILHDTLTRTMLDNEPLETMTRALRIHRAAVMAVLDVVEARSVEIDSDDGDNYGVGGGVGDGDDEPRYSSAAGGSEENQEDELDLNALLTQLRDRMEKVQFQIAGMMER